jgi:FtsH-binding integral membrane protein
MMWLEILTSCNSLQNVWPMNRQNIIIRRSIYACLSVLLYYIPQSNRIFLYICLAAQLLNLFWFRMTFEWEVLKRIKVDYEFQLYEPI